MDVFTEIDNIESTVLPLLTICSLTSEYTTKTSPRKPRNFDYNFSADITGFPQNKSPRLMELINDVQQCFETEATLLLDNHMSQNDVTELYNRYKTFLLSCYQAQTDYYDQEEKNNTQEIETFIDKISFDDINTSNSNTFSHDSTNFEFEFTSITTMDREGIKNEKRILEFDSSELGNVSDSLYPAFQQFHCQELQSTHGIAASPNNKEVGRPSADSLEFRTEDCFQPTRRRMTKENKMLLESVFSVKSFPNAAERKLIAEKCNLSPSQVRIWFTNKRARLKGKS